MNRVGLGQRETVRAINEGKGATYPEVTGGTPTSERMVRYVPISKVIPPKKTEISLKNQGEIRCGLKLVVEWPHLWGPGA